MCIEREGVEVGRVPVEDMATLVLDGPELSISHQLVGYCASHGVAVIFSDEKHVPVSVSLPLAGHSLHSATLRQQIDATVPWQKRAWQSIVKAKICAQADLAYEVAGDDRALRRLIPLVRSGDPDNVEARAAARYFEAVFGSHFIRDRDEPGINACLNYGYAVIRALVARGLVGAGLHPALGIFHRNQYNAFCLADDAMEPFRPMVDRIVWQMVTRNRIETTLTPVLKREIVQVLGGFVKIGDQRFPFLVGMERYAAALRRAICEGESLVVPTPCPPPEA